MHALDIPSTGGDPNLIRDSQADVHCVASKIEECANRGESVIVLSHSAGGWLACEASHGLDADSRAKRGLKGGIVKLCFVTAMVPDVGASVLGSIGGHDALPFLIVKGEVDVPNASEAKDIFYNDVSADIAAEAVSKITPGVYASRFDPLKYAAWKYIPCSYLKCEIDRAIPFAVQEAIIEHAGEHFVHIESCQSGHSPWLSMPDFTADFFRRAAGEDV